MRTPAEFVVTRHLLSHQGDSPTELARHLGLDPAVASRVAKRLREQGFWTSSQLLDHLRSLPERPPRKVLEFRVTNPELWFRAYHGPYWASGEAVASSVDGLDVVPGRFLVYVPPEKVPAAVSAVFEVLGKLAPTSQANLEIRVADSWLREGEQPNVVEKGQRLLDYLESHQIQLLRALRSGELVTDAPRILSA